MADTESTQSGDSRGGEAAPDLNDAVHSRPAATAITLRSWNACFRALRVDLPRTPAAVAGLLLFCAGTIAAASVGALPGYSLIVGRSLAVYGPAVFVLCLVVYLGGALLYLRAIDLNPPRTVLRRLSALLLVVLIFTALPHAFGTLAAYLHTPYVSKLYVIVVAVVASRLLLPGETKAMWQSVRSSRPVVAAGPWLPLALSALVVVFVAEAASVAAYGAAGAYGETPIAVLQLKPALWLLNAMIVGGVVCVVFAVTGRAVFSCFLVYPAYLALVVCNIYKVRILHSSIQPLDWGYLDDLGPFFVTFFGLPLTVALFVAAFAWLAALVYVWRRYVSNGSRLVRISVGVVAAILLYGSVTFGAHYSQRAMRLAGIDEIAWDPVKTVRRNGLAVELLLRIPESRVQAPPDYSEETMADCFARHARLADVEEEPATNGPSEDVNIIIYFIESLMEPRDLGVEYTAEPIPSIRAMSREHTAGFAIVPSRYCGSTLTNFEALSGMSMHFLPSGGPYNLFVKRDIPSLPRFLKSLGYGTTTVHGVGRTFSSYELGYRHLGIDDGVWLSDDPNVARDVTGRWPSDEAIVDAVIAAAERPGPQFVFAFPLVSHYPFDHDYFPQSDLQVVGPMSDEARIEAKAYLNSLREADKAVGRLARHFERSRRKTVIVILGDHLPPLSHQGGVFALKQQGDPNDLVQVYRTPLVIWSNFGLKKEDVTLGANFLGTYVLSRIGIKPRGFLAFNDYFRSRVRAISAIGEMADGTFFMPGTEDPATRQVLDDYGLVQYDYLFGKQYVLKQLGDADNCKPH